MHPKCRGGAQGEPKESQRGAKMARRTQRGIQRGGSGHTKVPRLSPQTNLGSIFNHLFLMPNKFKRKPNGAKSPEKEHPKIDAKIVAKKGSKNDAKMVPK